LTRHASVRRRWDDPGWKDGFARIVRDGRQVEIRVCRDDGEHTPIDVQIFLPLEYARDLRDGLMEVLGDG